MRPASCVRRRARAAVIVLCGAVALGAGFASPRFQAASAASRGGDAPTGSDRTHAAAWADLPRERAGARAPVERGWATASPPESAATPAASTRPGQPCGMAVLSRVLRIPPV